MTYRTTASRDHIEGLAVGDSAAAPRPGLAALLAQDEIVRRELRNDAILAGNRAARQDSARPPRPAGR